MPRAGSIYLKQRPAAPGQGTIFILTAGTSDIPVAEEAFVTCGMLGNEVERVYDVGVAGLHRLLGEYDRIKKARVIISLRRHGRRPAERRRRPVFASPSSPSRPASATGRASRAWPPSWPCSIPVPGGVGVVNIDNGFGAAYLASLINHA